MALAFACEIQAQSVAEARASMRAGEYEEAVTSFTRLLREDESSVDARRGLVQALRITGRYAEAEATASRAPNQVMLANTLGEVLVLQGSLDAAETAFHRAINGGADDRLTAAANLAELLFDRGNVDEAMERFDAFVDVYNDSDGRLDAPDLVAVGRAVSFLGRKDPDLFRDALRAFDEAARVEPGWTEPARRAGDLFLAKYTSPEAQAEYAKVLALNPNDPEALLGMARAKDFDGTAGARAYLEQILAVNPEHVGAHVLQARLHLSSERHEEAREEAEQALATNPKSLDALAALAAAHFVAGDTTAFRLTRERALALNPRSASLDQTVAEVAVQVRRYAESADRALAAVTLDSAAWTAWSLLGMNELRLGRIEEGREHLERAFSGDPYNPWVVNNLELLDSFELFEVVRTPHFELFLHGTESDLLTPLISEIAEEAYDSLARRYGTEPPLPIRVEVYPSHDDFSVRTLGETGLGALGVAFGSVVIMDSPAARQRGHYNWASTLWHELAHSFHLGMTDHKVPRWFSEGLAVHEQRKARAGWGHQPSIAFLEALRDGRLKTVSELNDGFMRPEYPQQVIFSYYQASLVFEVIERDHGFDAIRRMLDGYRRGATTPELFESVLGLELADFDDDFDGWLRSRFAAPLRGLAPLAEAPPAQAGPEVLEDFVRSHPGDLVARIRLGGMLVNAGRFDEARPHLDAALRMFPDYGGPDSPLWLLSRVHRANGDLELAGAALARLNSLSESNYTALLEQADVMAATGDTTAAAAALARTVHVYPYEIEDHRRMAEYSTRTGDFSAAVRSRSAVVALDPVDMAQALYMLAVAYRDAQNVTAARRAVIRALDVAPNFDDALELLLQLREGIGTGGQE
jgi:tetratricopeptide (TPR) repeat protein